MEGGASLDFIGTHPAALRRLLVSSWAELSEALVRPSGGWRNWWTSSSVTVGGKSRKVLCRFSRATPRRKCRVRAVWVREIASASAPPLICEGSESIKFEPLRLVNRTPCGIVALVDPIKRPVELRILRDFILRHQRGHARLLYGIPGRVNVGFRSMPPVQHTG